MAKIGRMLQGEGDYPKGALIAIHPGPGTAGALYVDEGRFDAWVAAKVLAPVKPEAETEKEVEEAEITPAPTPRRKKGGGPR